MNTPSGPENLQQMLDHIDQAAQAGNEKTTMQDVMSEVGRRSFGPALLVPGIITLMPLIGDIPGVPTVMGILVLSVAGQVLFGRRYFWMPAWILTRSVERQKIVKAVQWARPPARFVDRFLRKRLPVLTYGAGAFAIALCCIAIALIMPLMEFVPFTANVAGFALTLFGLSLMARDGVLAIVAFTLTVLAFGFVVNALV